MQNKMTIAVIREYKTPPDSRTVFSPKLLKQAQVKFPEFEFIVESSPNRCFSDSAYQDEGIQILDDVSHADIMIGVKEVPIERLVPNKSYFFFSHTLKAQPYNQKLLQAMIDQNITIYDHECLVNEEMQRIVAFGRWAGIVGAHNGLLAYGNRTQQFKLPRAKDSEDYTALQSIYKKSSFPAMKALISGSGRVSQGAREVLLACGFQELSKSEYLSLDIPAEPVFYMAPTEDLYERKDGGEFHAQEFYTQPELYQASFNQFTGTTDLFIHGIYWDPKADVFFTLDDIQKKDWRIKTIADITCDIKGSVPTTIEASTIAEPVFGFDIERLEKTIAYSENAIDVMSVDNLPNELPKDASDSFGEIFLNQVLEELKRPEDSRMLLDAAIAHNGSLGRRFQYLRGYVQDGVN